MAGSVAGSERGGFKPAVAAQRGGIQRAGGVAADGVDGERGAGGGAALGDEVEQLRGSVVALRSSKNIDSEASTIRSTTGRTSSRKSFMV